MANQHPDAEAARDLKALPADLQALYQRLSEDGHVWQAASAERLATLAESLVADIERMVGDGSVARHDAKGMSDSTTPVALPAHPPVAHPAHQHRREWIAGTVAAVAVVALLALVLQSALIGRGTTRPSNMAAGHWQVLDKLTVTGDIVTTQAPIIAPSDPRVVYEATNSISGQGGKAVTFASLRRTTDGGNTWHNVKLPLPVEAVETIQLQFSPLKAQTVFMSLWDRTSIACEPTSGTVGEGCEHGYVSYDGGDTWQSQKLPVRGILDLDQPFAIDQNRIFARNICNDIACIHLLMSADGGQTWQVIDDQLTAQRNRVCSYAATPDGTNVYAITTTAASAPQVACALPSSDTTLWRNDDAGGQGNATDAVTHWTELGPLPHTTPATSQGERQVSPATSQGNGQWKQQVSVIGGTVLSAFSGGLVYLTVAHWSDGSMPILFSEDYGVTWKSTAAFPPGMQPGLQVASSATTRDGTMVVAIQVGATRATLYTWKPGDATWTALPQLPATVSGLPTLKVVPDSSQRDTIMATLFKTEAGTTGIWQVVRYQM